MTEGVQYLPNLFPTDLLGPETPATKAWLSRLMYHRGIFNAIMTERLSIHELVKVSNNRHHAELLYNHTEAISELNKETSDPSRACTADNILAIVSLAYNGLDNVAVEPAKSPSQAPLMSL